MRKFEIVTHCWSGPNVPIYHLLLQFQLSSLLQQIDDLSVVVTVCYTPQDRQTSDVVDFFEPLFVGQNQLQRMPLEPSSLFRRAIGRHRAAKASTADVIWFTDCDHVFRGTVLTDAYHGCLASEHNLVFPYATMVHAQHGIGDALLAPHIDKPPQVCPDIGGGFVRRRSVIAIGGIQIAKGDFCRKRGYIGRRRFLQPVPAELGFQSCRGDIMFRRACGSSAPIRARHIYRIRHSRCGRDQGAVDHGRKPC